VLARLANPGQLVGAGAPIVQFGSSARGKVLRAGVPDRDALRLKVGAAAEVVFDAIPATVFRGRVSQIAAAADPRTGTYAIEVALDGVAALPSGLVGRVSIKGGDSKATQGNGAKAMTATPGVFAIPAEALVEGDSVQGAVFAVDVAGTRARRVRVTLVALSGDVVLVRGLDGVSRVVTAGATWLTDSARVEIKP
jgi:multidrug efflux pump subunit AcrA (membrane-fusion protein)